jgi:hypothetical protein
VSGGLGGAGLLCLGVLGAGLVCDVAVAHHSSVARAVARGSCGVVEPSRDGWAGRVTAPCASGAVGAPGSSSSAI